MVAERSAVSRRRRPADGGAAGAGAHHPLRRRARHRRRRCCTTVVRGMVSRVAAGLAAACVGLDDDASAAMAGAGARRRRRRSRCSATPSSSAAFRTARWPSSASATACTACCRVCRRGCWPMPARSTPTPPSGACSRSLSPGTAAARRGRVRRGLPRPVGCGAGARSAAARRHRPVDGDAARPTRSSTSLPLLRRTFGAFDAAERRSIGERVRTGRGARHASRRRSSSIRERVAAGAATPMAQLLGWRVDSMTRRRRRRRVHEGERLRRWRLRARRRRPAAARRHRCRAARRREPHGRCAVGAVRRAARRHAAAVGAAAARAGSAASAPSVARWLGDIRRYFPTGVVQVMQRDAIERLDLQRLLLEPEMLEAIEPDIHLVSTLLALQHLLPDTTRATARHGGRQGGRPDPGSGSASRRCRRSAARWPAARAPGARVRPTSTGTARSAPTCATTNRRSAPSCPSGSSATRGRARRCARS